MNANEIKPDDKFLGVPNKSPPVERTEMGSFAPKGGQALP